MSGYRGYRRKCDRCHRVRKAVGAFCQQCAVWRDGQEAACLAQGLGPIGLDAATLLRRFGAPGCVQILNNLYAPIELAAMAWYGSGILVYPGETRPQRWALVGGFCQLWERSQTFRDQATAANTLGLSFGLERWAMRKVLEAVEHGEIHPDSTVHTAGAPIPVEFLTALVKGNIFNPKARLAVVPSESEQKP